MYLPFLGMTLDSPLVAPLRHPIIRGVVLFGGLAIALSIFFLPDSTLESMSIDAKAAERLENDARAAPG